MTLPVVIAIAGALAVAAGAAYQERSVVAAPRLGQLRLLGFLVRSRGWCLGTVLTIAGVLAHMVALSHAPLIVIQPIGVSGLLFAVMLSAFFRRQRMTKEQVIGSLAVTAALAGLLATLPGHTGAPIASRMEAILMPVGCASVMGVFAVVARFTGPTTRAWTLALAGGVAYGATSAFARVIGSAAVTDVLALVQPLTLVALAIGMAGAVIVQNAYRSGHFALAYATLLISDPLAAAAIGVVFFDERMPTGPLDGSIAAGAAVLLVIGVVLLARSGQAAARSATQPTRTPPQPDRASGPAPAAAPAGEEGSPAAPRAQEQAPETPQAEPSAAAAEESADEPGRRTAPGRYPNRAAPAVE